jgi:hypothetical protein
MTMNTPTQGPNDKSRFCPTCGGADVEVSQLAGGGASCNICGWSGKVEELLTFHFSHNLGSPEQVFQSFFLDLRGVVSQRFLEQIGKLLIKWGFIDLPIDRKLFARYVGGMCKGIVKGIFDTRKEIEKEKHAQP